MYNETYHPISEDGIRWLLAGEEPAHQAIIKAKVAEEIEKKTRNYFINLPDGSYYMITNGIVQGSKGSR